MMRLLVKGDRMKLLFFMADVMRNPDLQSAFRKNPGGVMTEYGLNTAQQVALQSRDPGRIAQELKVELEKKKNDVTVLWPGPTLELKTFSPSSGAQGQSSLVVQGTGTNFTEDMTVQLVPEKSGSALPITLTSVTAGEQGSFSGLLSIPANATIGTYDAVATSLTTGSSTLDKAFKVTRG